MEHVQPYLVQAQKFVSGLASNVKQSAVKDAAKSALAIVDPYLSRCSWSTSQVNEAAFFALFAATLTFLTIAQRYQKGANKALIGFSWATAVSALNFYFLQTGSSPFGDFAVLQSVAGLPFVVYALSSLGNGGFFTFVLVLVHLVAKEYFLALGSLQSSFDAKVVYFLYSLAVGGFASLFIWVWGLRGGFRGFLVTLVFTESMLLHRAVWLVGKRGLNLISSADKEVLLFAIVEVLSELSLLLVVALFYPSASCSSSSSTPTTKPTQITKSTTTAVTTNKKRQ